MTDRPAERGPVPDTTAVRRTPAAAGRPTTPPPGAAPVGRARPTGAPAASKGRPAKAPRKARLSLTRVDPWSVMKMSFLLSIALGVVMIVAVLVLWGVLGAAGVWDSINRSVTDIVGDGSTWNVTDYLGTSRVLGFTMIVAVVDVVLFTAVATLGAFLYNLAAALLGGIEVTLSEEQ